MSHDDPLSPDGDPFGPPAISTLVSCLHCGEEYDSYRIVWRVEVDAEGQPHGFWCCPTEGCGGMGFGFDIFPVDPNYRDENGEPMWFSDDDEDDESCEADGGEEDWLPDEGAESESTRGSSASGEDDVPW